MDTETIATNISGMSENRRRRPYFENHLPEFLIELDKFNIGKHIKNFSQLTYHYCHSDTPYPNYCKVCQNETKFISFHKGYSTYCSRKCVMGDECIVAARNKKSRDTSIRNWGVSNPMKSEIVKSSMVDSVRKKYGVDYYTQTDEYINNMKEINLGKYGVEWYMATSEFKTKSINTSKLNHGVNHPMKSEKVRHKLNNSIKNKYGVDNYSKTEEFKEFMETYYLSDNHQNNILLSKELRKNKIFKYYDNYNDNYNLLSISSDVLKLWCDDCDSEFEIRKQLYYLRTKSDNLCCTNCNPVDGKNISLMEKEIYDMVDMCYDGKLIPNYNDRYEIDIFLPDIDFGIEYNGLWYHSDNFKDSDYHIKKKEYFLERNINIFMIWEDDWEYKRDIVLSMIKYKLGIVSCIGARKCVIRNVDRVNTKQFLVDNHLQGYVNYKTSIGLYNNDELVSMMCFGKSRDRKNDMEMLRFCNKKYISVTGGASKLFKYFIKESGVDKVISYADINHSDGSLYKKMGFELTKVTKPGYWWCKDGIKYNRFNFRKSKLIKDGYDGNKTESEIMISRKFYKVYNCGNYKYVYIS